MERDPYEHKKFGQNIKLIEKEKKDLGVVIQDENDEKNYTYND